jgi:hypothetical protein
LVDWFCGLFTCLTFVYAMLRFPILRVSGLLCSKEKSSAKEGVSANLTGRQSGICESWLSPAAIVCSG